MPVLELELSVIPIKTNSSIPVETKRDYSTRRIGNALRRIIAIHRSGELNHVDAVTRNDILNQLNQPISLGNIPREQLLGQFHSQMMSQPGRRKVVDVNIINTLVNPEGDNI